MIDPSHDTDEALKEVLECWPEYFDYTEGDVWQKVLRKMGVGAVWWARREDHENPLDYVVGFFPDLEDDIAALRSAVKTGTQAGQQVKSKPREFLENTPRMVFVIDTSAPLDTIRQALQKMQAVIQGLRKEVGLQENGVRNRLRDWKKHLEVYEAVLPQRERNKKAWRIWREGLSFAEAFKLLSKDGELSPQERQLFQELDKVGRKPRDVFKAYVKTSERGHGRGKKGDVESGFDSSGNKVPTVDFDFAEVELRVEGASVEVAKTELPAYANQLEAMLAVWLPHFTWTKHRWPDGCRKWRPNRRWLKWAEERIAAAWREG